MDERRSKPGREVAWTFAVQFISSAESKSGRPRSVRREKCVARPAERLPQCFPTVWKR